MGVAATFAIVVLGALWLSSSASASCATLIADPAPGYTGGGPAGLSCDYDAASPTETWTVPAGIVEARFWAIGGDGPGARGGSMRATLSVVPGQVYELTPGGPGGATSVGRDGVKLLVGGGADGVAPNYAVPEAREVEQVAPGAGVTGYALNGRVYVSWDAGITKKPREPNEGGHDACVVPRITGRTPKAARAALAEAGCAAGPVTRKASRSGRRGRVVSQSVRPGLETVPGAEVAFAVGRRP